MTVLFNPSTDEASGVFGSWILCSVDEGLAKRTGRISDIWGVGSAQYLCTGGVTLFLCCA